jgi:hypothetical protein
MPRINKYDSLADKTIAETHLWIQKHLESKCKLLGIEFFPCDRETFGLKFTFETNKPRYQGTIYENFRRKDRQEIKLMMYGPQDHLNSLDWWLKMIKKYEHKLRGE